MLDVINSSVLGTILVIDLNSLLVVGKRMRSIRIDALVENVFILFLGEQRTRDGPSFDRD